MSKFTIGAIAATAAMTVFLSFNATTVFQEISAYAGGCFAVLVILAIYIIQRLQPAPAVKPRAAVEPEPRTMSDEQIERAVRSMRDNGYADSFIASVLHIDADVVAVIK